MANEDRSDRRVPTERNPLKESTRPSPQVGPPMSNDGLESPRSSHC